MRNGSLRSAKSGPKLPSQRTCASGVPASLLAAYSGGAAPELHRLPYQHRVIHLIRQAYEPRQAPSARTTRWRTTELIADSIES